jgi:TPR repeat protein
VARDEAEAVTWFMKAAEQENFPAQYNLGVIYAKGGNGVTQDYVRAYLWFSLAASCAPDASMRENSVKYRDDIAVEMIPAQIAEAQRMAREWMQSHSSRR